MRILDFDKLIRSEISAHRYLVRRRWRGRDKRCLNCNSKRLYRLGEGRYRCSECGYTFGDLTGTWLAQSRISAIKWLWLIKLFELEITAWQAAAQLGVSYPTVLRAFTIVRRAVLSEE